MSIFATIKWDTEDIASVRPDWDVAKVEDAASYASKPLEESCVKQGRESLEVLLDIFEFEQERKENEDIGTLGCEDPECECRRALSWPDNLPCPYIRAGCTA